MVSLKMMLARQTPEHQITDQGQRVRCAHCPRETNRTMRVCACSCGELFHACLSCIYEHLQEVNGTAHWLRWLPDGRDGEGGEIQP